MMKIMHMMDEVTAKCDQIDKKVDEFVVIGDGT